MLKTGLEAIMPEPGSLYVLSRLYPRQVSFSVLPNV